MHFINQKKTSRWQIWSKNCHFTGTVFSSIYRLHSHQPLTFSGDQEVMNRVQISEWCWKLRKWRTRRQRGLQTNFLGEATGYKWGWGKSPIFQGQIPRSPGYEGVIPLTRNPKGVWREMEETQLIFAWKEGKKKGDANTSYLLSEACTLLTTGFPSSENKYLTGK